MIYATQARAIEVTKMLNSRKGYPPAHILLHKEGWTIVCAWVRPSCKCDRCMSAKKDAKYIYQEDGKPLMLVF